MRGSALAFMWSDRSAAPLSPFLYAASNYAAPQRPTRRVADFFSPTKAAISHFANFSSSTPRTDADPGSSSFHPLPHSPLLPIFPQI